MNSPDSADSPNAAVNALCVGKSLEFKSLRRYRLRDLNSKDFPTHRALTAALGLSAESGEFTEIVKKIVFQGKPVNQENLFHMKRELGDIMWYFIQACIALDVSPEEIIEMNVEKLKSRYPGGEFDVHYSENRKQGDL